MYKLLDFLARHKHWFVFLALEFICGVQLYQRAMYQRSYFIHSAGTVVAHISATSGAFRSYLDLRDINHALTERNTMLEMRVLDLQQRLTHAHADSMASAGLSGERGHFPYRTFIAKVVSNSVAHTSNYITIDKGKADGIAVDMGVISDYGVVGIISHVSEHFSVVLPILNPRHRLSCKLLRTNYFGSLGWNGRDARYAQLGELPRHAQVETGDTVVTSGFSAIFPEGLLVGTIREYEKNSDENFHSAIIRLSVDFASLKDVHVVVYEHAKEQLDLKKETEQ